MNKINILDCTLRDGGYCNQWKFGFDNIKKIVNSLDKSGIDIIECGFLTNKVSYDPDITKFTVMTETEPLLAEIKESSSMVVMMNYGEYEMAELPDYTGKGIDGIRLAFHKKDLEGALTVCEEIKRKGYKLFIQPMVSLNYSDEEFLYMIHRVNEINPYAFYIVDSFGTMKKKNLIRLFYMVEHNLNENIWIGFHSHNNLQLAYSNALALVEAQTNRNLIIDSSVYGMGRGAGNLNTELFVEYLNDNIGASYEIRPLLTIIDEILNGFYQENYWGYTLPNYLSATHSAHPNYAGYLADKNTLTVEAMNEIFMAMDPEKKVQYDKNYIEKLYLQYMEEGRIYEEHEMELKNVLKNKKVLLIAPGKSAVDEAEKIKEYIKNPEIISISVNYDYIYSETDYIFISNMRRFKQLDKEKYSKSIITSNIEAEDVFYKTKYFELLNTEEAVKDNAGMMAIKFLINMGVEEVLLAGFDGYSYMDKENYVSQELMYITKNEIHDAMNKGMCKMLKKFSDKIKIEFLTEKKRISF